MGEFQDYVAKPAMKALPWGGKILLKSAIKGPAVVHGAIQLATEEDKLRAAAGIAGGLIGGGIGTAAGTALGGVNAPVGAVVGSAFGQDFATDLYDDNHEAIHQKLDETKRWMKARQQAIENVAGSADAWVKARANGITADKLDRTYRARGR